MNITEFVSKLESAFGDYRAGMSSAIIQALGGLEEEELNKVYMNLITTREQKGAPNLAVIKKSMEAENVFLKKTNQKSWIHYCGKCGRHFSLDYGICPDCGNRGKYPFFVKPGKLIPGQILYSKPKTFDKKAEQEKLLN